MSKTHNSIFIFLLIITLCFNNTINPIFASEKVEMTISTEKQFLEFANLCKSDTYSKNKIVKLTSDLDLSSYEFHGVPIFFGTFDGGGYTISGINADENSYKALFWHIAEYAVVENLTVKSNIETENSFVGGIASVNDGTVNNCTFEGLVRGSDIVGGIVGQNNGLISNSNMYGNVLGTSNVGGIVGENIGRVEFCDNYAILNENIDKLNISNTSSLNSSLAIQSESIFNIAGIAGYNSGAISQSTNYGNIGYAHVGMNIGGIVGHQYGIIQNCVNEGNIYGRNQVGGIAGYFEPYTQEIEETPKMEEVRNELNTLNARVDDLTKTAKNSNSNIDKNGEVLQNSIKVSKNDVEDVLLEFEYIFDANVDVVNEISSIISEAVDGFVPVLDSLENVENSLTESLDYFEMMSDEFGFSVNKLDELELVEDEIREEFDDIHTYFDMANDSFSNIITALEDIDNSIDQYALSEILETIPEHLLDASYSLEQLNADLADMIDVLDEASAYYVNSSVYFENVITNSSATMRTIAKTMTSFSQITSAIQQITALLSNSSTTPDMTTVYNLILNLQSVLVECQTSMGEISGNIFSTSNSVDSLVYRLSSANLSTWQSEFFTALDGGNSATQNMIDEIVLINEAIVEAQTYVDTEEVLNAFDKISPNVSKAQDNLFNAYDAFHNAILISENATDILYDSSEYFQNSIDNLGDGIECLNDTVSYLGETIDLFSEVVDTLSKREDIVFVKTEESFDVAKDNLSNSIDVTGNSMSNLLDSVTDSSDNIIDEVAKINSQLAVVQNLMIDIIDEAVDFDLLSSLEVVEMTAEKIAETNMGKIISSTNNALVQADSNVGGIVGGISFKNPEFLSDGLNNLNFLNIPTSEGLALVDSCENTGFINGKKDNIGGIVGFVEFGTVQFCVSTNVVKSTEGDNIGGIAGYSLGKIQKNYAKNVLEGLDNIGGIVGFGEDIINNYALSVITSTSGNIGGIAGYIDDGIVSNNYFVSEILGGISGISYIGQAETISYIELCEIEGLPNIFYDMNIQFFADDVIVENFSVEFNEDFEKSNFPEVPYKEGYFGRWSDFDTYSVKSDISVSAEYFPAVTTLSSSDKLGELPIVLVNGSYTDLESVSIMQDEMNSNEIFAQYRVLVTGENNIIENIRFLLPEENVKLQVMQDGNWVDVDTVQDGKYTVFSPSDNVNSEVEFRALYQLTEYQNISNIIRILSAVIFVGMSFKLIRKKHSVN